MSIMKEPEVCSYCLCLKWPLFEFWAFSLFQESQLQELLVSLHTLPLPESGVPVHLGAVSLTALPHYISLNW